MWARYIFDPLRGKTPLLHVVLGCLAANVVLIAPLVLLQPSADAAVLTAVLVGACVSLVESAMVWQCAYNSPFQPLGIFVRMSLGISVVVVLPLFLYAAISDPSSVQFGG